MKDMKKSILFYYSDKKYFEFSNFSEHPIVIDGKTYATNEHYFQSVKFLETETVFLKEFKVHIPYQEVVRCAKTPGQAKKLGASRKFKIHPNWDDMRINAMRKAVDAKFKQYPELRAMLLETGDAILKEDSPTDSFWGIAKQKDGSEGKNMLGILLMQEREHWMTALDYEM